MVAVHGGRHRGLVALGQHELEQRHLRRRVLHGDPIGMRLHVAAPGGDLGALGIGEVAEEDLLGVAERTAEPPAHALHVAREPGVHGPDQLRRRLDGGHASSWDSAKLAQLGARDFRELGEQMRRGARGAAEVAEVEALVLAVRVAGRILEPEQQGRRASEHLAEGPDERDRGAAADLDGGAAVAGGERTAGLL